MVHREFYGYAIRVGDVGSASASVRPRAGDLALALFLLAPACDGVLTYVGVRTFGMAAEGNPLVAWLMTVMGHGAGLAAAKVTAGGLGIALHLSDVHGAVAVLAGFYLVVAVGPWIALLLVWS